MHTHRIHDTRIVNEDVYGPPFVNDLLDSGADFGFRGDVAFYADEC